MAESARHVRKFQNELAHLPMAKFSNQILKSHIEIPQIRAGFSRVCLSALGLAALLSAPLLAHHSFAAEFDQSKPIKLKGVLSGVALVNPHGWLKVDVTDDAFNKRLDPP